jgi:glycolate oxidase
VAVEGFLQAVSELVGADRFLGEDAVGEELTHDEGLLTEPVVPIGVVFPESAGEVAELVRLARVHRVPLTARGSASGLSGACVPAPGGLVVSFARMNRILEIDRENQIAVVEPGVTLDELDAALEPHGLMYPVRPGEQSASLGGNVSTNAGGMRAVRFGVTRQNVLGIEVVLGTGELIRSGGKFVKSSSGYDVTQMLIGSEGTLGLVTEVTLKLQPLLPASATVLAPFDTLAEIATAIPEVLRRGLTPTILEYIDALTMGVMVENEKLDLNIPDEMRRRAAAYLVAVVDHRSESRVEEDLETLASLLTEFGALDVFVLPPQAGRGLVLARERAFYGAKAAGADEIVDVVVPRASIAEYLELAGKLAAEHGSFVAGCGHAGDGNVHLAVFQRDPALRERVLSALIGAGVALGGAISGEHGIGTAKSPVFMELESPARIALMRRVKDAFDPDGILNPDKIFGAER